MKYYLGGINTQTFSTGKGANVFVSSRNLIVQDFSTIGTISFSEGGGGDISLNAQNRLEVLGTPPVRFLFLPSTISTFTTRSGQAGNINVSGKLLSILDGGLVFSQTFGRGKGGNITGYFSESVEIAGSFPVELTSNSFIKSTLGTSTLVSGNAGDVSINTRQFSIKAGGRINATTAASGNAGNIRIDATDSVEVEGKVPSSNASIDSSQIVASATKK